MQYKEGDKIYSLETKELCTVSMHNAMEMLIFSDESDKLWVVPRIDPEGFSEPPKEKAGEPKGTPQLNEHNIKLQLYSEAFINTNSELSLKARTEEAIQATQAVIKEIFS